MQGWWFPSRPKNQSIRRPKPWTPRRSPKWFDAEWLLIDIIDGKRKAEGATSVWDRSMANVQRGRGYSDNPNIQRFIRETGHIEYAAKLGLGEYDRSRIQLKEIQ